MKIILNLNFNSQGQSKFILALAIVLQDEICISKAKLRGATFKTSLKKHFWHLC